MPCCCDRRWWPRPSERRLSMKGLTPPTPAELRERRIGGRSTAAQRAPSTNMTMIATMGYPSPSLFPLVRNKSGQSVRYVPQTQSEIPEDLACCAADYQRLPAVHQAMRRASAQVRGFFRDSSQLRAGLRYRSKPSTSTSRRNTPERPPVFSHSARSVIVIARSSDLHMS
jgi:hypothetical protein